MWERRAVVGRRCCVNSVCSVEERMVSRVVMSACVWGVKPASVTSWRHVAMVRASGLLV